MSYLRPIPPSDGVRDQVSNVKVVGPRGLVMMLDRIEQGLRDDSTARDRESAQSIIDLLREYAEKGMGIE